MTAPSEKGFTIEKAVVAGGETALGLWGLGQTITRTLTVVGVSPAVSMITLGIMFGWITLDGIKKTGVLLQPRTQ